MKIHRISVYHVDLPLEHPYWLSGGRLKFEVLDATFVKVETDEGLVGWGEGTPWGHTYVPAHGPGIRAWAFSLTKRHLVIRWRSTNNGCPLATTLRTLQHLFDHLVFYPQLVGQPFKGISSQSARFGLFRTGPV